MSFLRRAFESRDAAAAPEARMIGSIDSYGTPGTYGNSNIPTNGMSGWDAATGVSVSDHTALGLTAFYACVRLLADSIASLPWDAYRKGDMESDVRREVSPQPSLLRSPWSEMTTFDWKHMMMVSLCMRGNFYGLISERDNLGYPTMVLPLHPDRVLLTRNPETMQRQLWINGNLHPLEDLFHIRAFSLPGYDVGLSPIAMARHSLGLGLAAQSYGATWFRDGASPSSVLEADNELTPEQATQLQQSWVNSHGGRRRPAVLSGVKWKAITITPEESQFLQTRQHQASEVAQMMGIPPHMIGMVEKSTSWGRGIEQQSIGFVTYTLRPWLTRIEAAMTDALPRGQYAKFNVDGLLRGDQASRYAAYETAINSGWRNPDEVRALEELPPIPGGAGKMYRQPLNYAPLGYDPAKAAADAAAAKSMADSAAAEAALAAAAPDDTTPTTNDGTTP